MSEAESRIKCGAEIYSSNNHNNNEGGNEEDPTRTSDWTKLPSPTTTIPGLDSTTTPKLYSSQYSSVRPFVSSNQQQPKDSRELPLPLEQNQTSNSKGHSTKSSSSSELQKSFGNSTSPTSTHKKIRLPLAASNLKSAASGKNRKDSSIPVGIAVARQRHVNVTAEESTETITASPVATTATMSSQNLTPTTNLTPSPGVQNIVKSKRASPTRPQAVSETAAVISPGRIKSDRHNRKGPSTTFHKSNTDLKMQKSGPSDSRSATAPVPEVRLNSGTPNPRIVEADNIRSGSVGSLTTAERDLGHQHKLQERILYPERGRLGEIGVSGDNNGHDFRGYNGGFAHNPQYGDWASRLNVPHLPSGYNTAAAYMQQQHQQLSMHPEMPLHLSQSYGYAISPYLYSGYPTESILQYEQFFRQQHQQQQQQTREELLRLQQQHQQQRLGPLEYEIARPSPCRSATPIPSLSPRISIPSPPLNSHPNLNLYSHHPHWSTDLYQSNQYLTSSTATLSPRSLTSSTPSPITVHDSHSYLLARKCITPNPIGVNTKHFAFSSPFSPSLPHPTRETWKETKISPIARKPGQDNNHNKMELSPSDPEPEREREIERANSCKTPGSVARHDFRRMESLIEKREPILSDEMDADAAEQDNNHNLELESQSQVVKIDSPKQETCPMNLKVCDATEELRVPETFGPNGNFGNKKTCKGKAAAVAVKVDIDIEEKQVHGQTKISRTKAARPTSATQGRPSSASTCSKNDTQMGNSEKYFIPVKREFIDYNHSSSSSSIIENPSNFATLTKTKSPSTLNSSSSGGRDRVVKTKTKSASIRDPSTSDNRATAATHPKSFPAIDISRVKREVIVENIYALDVRNTSSRTSAAGDNCTSALKRSSSSQRSMETDGCSSDADINVDVVSPNFNSPSSSSQDLDYFAKIASAVRREERLVNYGSQRLAAAAEECDSGDIIDRNGGVGSGQKIQPSHGHGHNITVTVSLPPPEDGDSIISPKRLSTSTDPESEVAASFPKIVISSAESHLNLLATVAQEIGPYISMNTNRSPRRYESLIQIEPTTTEVFERRSSVAGSTASTSTISRISIDDNTAFSPATISQTSLLSDREEVTASPIGHAERSTFEAEAARATPMAPNSAQLLPYQLKIPQVIPRLQSNHPVKNKKDRKKAADKPEKPKKISRKNVQSEEKKVQKVKAVRPMENASTKLTKKPKMSTKSLEPGTKQSQSKNRIKIKDTTAKKALISKKTNKKSKDTAEIAAVKGVKATASHLKESFQQPTGSSRNPCIYDFDDSKPNLEPLYNRLEKPGYTQPPAPTPHNNGRALVEVEDPLATMTTSSSIISNHDLKRKSLLSSDSKLKAKATTRPPKANLNAPDVNPEAKKTNPRKRKMVAEDQEKPKKISRTSGSGAGKEVKRKTKGIATVTNLQNLESGQLAKPAADLVLRMSSTPLAPTHPTMQFKSLLSTMAALPAGNCEGQGHGHDSSSNEDSTWVADPAHAVKAISTTNLVGTLTPRRLSAEERAAKMKKRRKAMKPSKLTVVSNHENHVDDRDRDQFGSTSPSSIVGSGSHDTPKNTLKSQLKSFVHFTTRKKNGHHHHHIKPCLKAEPEFKEEIPTSEESELEDLEDLKPIQILTPSPLTVSASLGITPAKPIKIRKPSIDMNIFSRKVRVSEDGAKDSAKGSLDGIDRNEEAAWNENVVISGVEEMLDEMRILTEIQGLFYTGKLNALQPPDVYGVTLDNERGAPPHLIYSAEEVLEKCIREAKPWRASQLPHGLRICAYWSPQYSGLYPGKVSTDYDTITDLVPVEFDDGDTGVIKIGEIRLLASNHPIREYDPNPLLTLEKKHRKRHHSSAAGSQSSECNGLHEDADCGESYCAKVAKKDSEEEEELGMSDCQESSGNKLQYWTWNGFGYKRPGTKKNRNKEFYHGIQRGDEVIKVGDSALFISNGNVRPFLGRVERFWEKKGKKIVNVRWFYHPEEVKTKKRLSGIKYPGALFESPHIDENDVQTIARKCEVLPFDKFQEKYGHLFTSKAGRSLSGQNKKEGSPKDTYYLAGYYDPYTYNLRVNDLNHK